MMNGSYSMSCIPAVLLGPVYHHLHTPFCFSPAPVIPILPPPPSSWHKQMELLHSWNLSLPKQMPIIRCIIALRYYFPGIKARRAPIDQTIEEGRVRTPGEHHSLSLTHTPDKVRPSCQCNIRNSENVAGHLHTLINLQPEAVQQRKTKGCGEGWSSETEEALLAGVVRFYHLEFHKNSKKIDRHNDAMLTQRDQKQGATWIHRS